MDFSLPTRIKWDVDHRGRLVRPKRIARQICELAPRSVELRIEGKRGISEFSSIFAELHRGGSRIETRITLFPGALSVLRWGYPTRYIWEVDSPRSLRDLLPAGAGSVSFTPDEVAVDLLPDMIGQFAESAAEELYLPNVNAVRAVAGGGHILPPRPEQYREAAGKIARARVRLGGKRIFVFDVLLWDALRRIFPEDVGERMEFSGCQAGSSLAHIDWEGNVYPCDSLPVRLGNLFEAPFERIWRSPARLRLVEAVGAMIPDRESRSGYSGCLGGCRGLAYYLSQSPGGSRRPRRADASSSEGSSAES